MFDGVDLPPKRPSRRPVNETAITIVIVVFALAMLVTPISLAALVDVVRAIRGH
jgi:hypothetical protein